MFDKVRETFHAVYDDMKDYLENIQVIKVQKQKMAESIVDER